MGYLGATIYHFDPTIAARLRLLQPSHLVVGEGAWFALRDIADIVGPDCKLILRDVLGATLTNQPGVIASRIEIAAKSSGVFGQCIAHGLNEEYSQAAAAALWELRFIEHCRNLGLPTICLNLAYGNDPPDVLRPVAEASDFVGAHCYDGWIDAEQRFIDDFYTSRRYLGAGQSIPDNHWPAWWDDSIRQKHIPTEVGVERKPERGRVGWSADDGPSETAVRFRIEENIQYWQRDGLLGPCWYTLGHNDRSWDSYYPTDDQLRAWAAVPAIVNLTPVPLRTETAGSATVTIELFSPVAGTSPSNTGGAMPTLDDIAEKFLEIQRQADKAKAPNATFEEMGRELDRIPELAGDGYNLVQALKATTPTVPPPNP